MVIGLASGMVHLKLQGTDLQRQAAAAPDYLEGVGAFLAKRPARFTGTKS